MAEANGPQIGHWRCHMAAFVIAQDNTTATIRVQSCFQALGWGYAVSNFNTARCYCDGQDTGYRSVGAVNVPSGGNAILVMLQHDFRVAKTDKNRTVRCLAGFHLGGYETGTSEASLNLSIGAQAWNKPNAPSGLSVSRVDDSSATLRWVNHPDNANRKPYTQIIIDRCDAADGGAQGAWRAVATLAGTASSWKGAGLRSNGRYGYRILARNKAGDSAHVQAPWLYTTPDAPRGVTAVKTSESLITVSGDVSNSWPSKVMVERQTGSDSWQTLGDATVVNGNASYSDSTPPAGTVTYRMTVARNTTGDPSSPLLYSIPATSNTVTTITPPLAPTITSPLQGAAVDISDEEYQRTGLPVTWTPNHPDGSAQTAAQIEYSRTTDGDFSDVQTLTGQVTGSATTYGLELASFWGLYRVRVRTKGLADDWGAWSDYRTFNVGDPPTVVVYEPPDNGEITSVPFWVRWSVTIPEFNGGFSDGMLTLSSQSGQMLGRWPFIEGVVGTQVRPDMYLPGNGETMTATVTVRDGLGLTGSDSSVFTANYTPPGPITGIVDYTEGYAANITVAYSQQTPETVNASVSRVNPDGSLLMLDENVEDKGTVTDPLPPLNTDYSYRLTAYASSGAANSVDIPARVEAEFAVLNFGSDAGEYLRFAYDATFRHELTHATTEYHFARGSASQAYPSSYALRQTDRHISVDCSWTWDSSWYLKALDLAARHTYAWYREPSGFRAYVKAEQSISVDEADNRRIGYSADLTQLVWEEPVI